MAEVKSLRQISKDKFKIETELTSALQTIDELRFKARVEYINCIVGIWGVIP